VRVAHSKIRVVVAAAAFDLHPSALQVLTGGVDQLSDNLRPAFDLAWECYQSKPG
jgi:hypothetical protein